MANRESELTEAVARGIGKAAGNAAWAVFKWFLIVNGCALALWGLAELYLHLYPI